MIGALGSEGEPPTRPIQPLLYFFLAEATRPARCRLEHSTENHRQVQARASEIFARFGFRAPIGSRPAGRASIVQLSDNKILPLVTWRMGSERPVTDSAHGVVDG
jgi:hypothetical protein